MLNDHYAEYWREIKNVNKNLKESICDVFKHYEQKDLIWVFKYFKERNKEMIVEMKEIPSENFKSFNVSLLMC